MRKTCIVGILLLTGSCLLLAFLYTNKENGADRNKEKPVTEISWFSDEQEWNPAEWSLDKDTPTGKITEKTGVKINYKIPQDNADSRLSLMLIDGNAPDIISVSDSRMKKHLIESGLVWNIEELLESWLPESHLLKDYPKDVRTAMQERDGGWYGLVSGMHSPDNRKKWGEPDVFYQEFQDKYYNCGIIWNKALLKRLGMTIEDVREEEQVFSAFDKVCKSGITVNGEEVIPMLIDGEKYQDTSLRLLCSFFGAGETEGSRHQESLRTDEGKHALQFLNRAIRDGYLDPEQFVAGADQVNSLLKTGRVLCFIGDIRHAQINPGKWISSGAILSEDGSKPKLGRNRQIMEEQATTFVSKNCKYPEAAARWLDYMTSAEGMKLYLETSKKEWWPLIDADWYYVQKGKPEEKEEEWGALLCAFADMPETEIYESFEAERLLENEYLRKIESNISKVKKKYLQNVLLADTEEIFEKRYSDFLCEIESAGTEIWK